MVRVGIGTEADYRIRDARWDLRTAELELSTPSGPLTVETRLPGHHNARNVAAVVALGDLLGVERPVLAEVLATHPGARGRFEHLDCGQDHELILDTAGTPAATEQFLDRGAGGNGSGRPPARGARSAGSARPRPASGHRPRRTDALRPAGPHRGQLPRQSRPCEHSSVWSTEPVGSAGRSSRSCRTERRRSRTSYVAPSPAMSSPSSAGGTSWRRSTTERSTTAGRCPGYSKAGA